MLSVLLCRQSCYHRLQHGFHRHYIPYLSTTSTTYPLLYKNNFSSKTPNDGEEEEANEKKPEKPLTPKQQAKEKRREQWKRKEERRARLQVRRAGRERYKRRNKFHEWFDGRKGYQNIMIRNAKNENLDWKIKVATLVERLPVVTPDLEEWEDDYLGLKAYLDSFGERLPPPFGPDPEDEEEFYKLVSKEEILASLPEGFEPAPRVTEDDKCGNIRTRNRKLPERLYLAVKGFGDKLGKQYWTFPMAEVQSEETLLQAAVRAVKETVGDDLELYCISNCPLAVDLKVYYDDDKTRNGENFIGEKIFYHKIQWRKGDVREDVMTPHEYGWLTREEIVERIKEDRGEKRAVFYHYML